VLRRVFSRVYVDAPVRGSLMGREGWYLFKLFATLMVGHVEVVLNLVFEYRVMVRG